MDIHRHDRRKFTHLMAGALALALADQGCLADPPESPGQQPSPIHAAKPLDVANPKAIEQRWGIKIEGMHLSAAGYMLDFRFRVLDPGKAAPLLDRKHHALAIAEKTQAKFEVPRMPRVGALRQTTQAARKDQIYFLLFGNPGKTVRSGDKVAVRIGDFEIGHIVVDDGLGRPQREARFKPEQRS
ncbi:hypothetical protein [Methylomagnum sp.]